VQATTPLIQESMLLSLDTSVKLREILATRKDNVSRFEEETNAVLAEISQVRESVNKHLDEIEGKLSIHVRI
jgi:hypothetical protein